MKTISFALTVLLAAGSAGVALLTLSGLFQAELGFASLAVLGLMGVAVFDYNRPQRSLTINAEVLRPALPSESTSPVAYCCERAA